MKIAINISFVTLMHMQLPGTSLYYICSSNKRHFGVTFCDNNLVGQWFYFKELAQSVFVEDIHHITNTIAYICDGIPHVMCFVFNAFRPLYSYRILSNQTNTSSSMLLIVNSMAFLVFVRLMQSLQTCPHMPTTTLVFKFYFKSK